jgi:hypothetical protein
LSFDFHGGPALTFVPSEALRISGAANVPLPVPRRR